MATLVEVTTTKPTVSTVTLKLSTGEARDLQVFIQDWYGKNSYNPSGFKSNSVYTALGTALSGKAGSDITKVAAPVF